MRRFTFAFALVASACTLGAQGSRSAPAAAFTVVEATIPQMQAAMAKGQVTSRQLVEQYLMRLGLYEDRLNAALAINPRALQEADALDRERAQGKLRGPLHGIPVALKDNIHTTDMPTTGGALAFAGYVPPYEATLTRNLKAAGAIIIAKTGLTELANWVAGNPNAMPGNYNAVGGFAFNPYDPRPDPRPDPGDGRPVMQTGGSSSGIGTAANLWAGSVGSDTGGSIISPSNANMLVGIRPTIGRISRYGVIPITADHDTAGPMTRTVADSAIMLGAMEGASPDPSDPATRTCTPPPNRDYTKFLNAGGLKGARIGVPRAFYIDQLTLPGEKTPRGGINAEQAKVMADAIAVLKQHGAIVVDPAEIPSVVAKDANDSFPLFEFCSGAEHAKGKDQNCSINFKYGMKRDYNAWLTSLGSSAPGQDAEGAPRMEPRAREGRRHQVPAVTLRHLRRDRSRRGQGPPRRRRCEGSASQPRSRHRRRVEGPQARCLHHAGRIRRAHRRDGGLPHHRGAIRQWCRTRRNSPSPPGSTPNRRRMAWALSARSAANRDSSRSPTRLNRPRRNACRPRLRRSVFTEEQKKEEFFFSTSVLL